MKKKVEDIEMVVDGTAVETVATEVVQPAFTATKTIQNGLTFYEVNVPNQGKAKLTITDKSNGGVKTTIKLIELSDAEFADEALLKAKLIK